MVGREAREQAAEPRVDLRWIASAMTSFPAPVSPSKMTETEVNQMLGQETAKSDKVPTVRIDVERGDRVKIKDGPFENFEGTVEEVIEARGLVKVMLIIFNRPTPVDLEYWQVERI